MKEQIQLFYEASSKPKILLGDAWLEFAEKNIKGIKTINKNKFKSNLNKLHKAYLKGLVYFCLTKEQFIKIENLEVLGKTKFKINDKEYRFIDRNPNYASFKTNSNKLYKPEEFPTYFYFGQLDNIDLLYIKKEQK